MSIVRVLEAEQQSTRLLTCTARGRGRARRRAGGCAYRGASWPPSAGSPCRGSPFAAPRGSSPAARSRRTSAHENQKYLMQWSEWQHSLVRQTESRTQ